jgi:hypothetical protein
MITSIVMIHHRVLDLLRIEFCYFYIYDIFDIVTRVTGLKS